GGHRSRAGALHVQGRRSPGCTPGRYRAAALRTGWRHGQSRPRTGRRGGKAWSGRYRSWLLPKRRHNGTGYAVNGYGGFRVEWHGTARGYNRGRPVGKCHLPRADGQIPDPGSARDGGVGDDTADLGRPVIRAGARADVKRPEGNTQGKCKGGVPSRAADLQEWRRGNRALAVPAGEIRLPFRRYVLCTAARAGYQPVPEGEKEVLPFPLGDPPVRVVEAFGKGPGKHRFECGGAEFPPVTCDCIVRVSGQPVCRVIRVEYKDRGDPVDLFLCRNVPAVVPVLHLPMEWVVPDPEVEEQDRQGVEVSLSRGVTLLADQLRGHVFERSPDLAVGLAVDADIVVVADQDITGFRVKHQVSCRDIPVAVAGEVKRPVTVCELVRDLAERGNPRDRF